MQASHFSTEKDASASREGWQGRRPPKETELELRRRFDDGTIKRDLAEMFLPIPYDPEK